MSFQHALTKFQARMTGLRPGRLFLGDVQIINPHTAKLLLGWGRSLPKPTTSDVTDWTLTAFDGKLRPVLATIRHHSVDPMRSMAGGALELIVEHVVALRSLNDASNMIRVHASAYLDEHKNMWEVRTDDGGQKFMVRKEKENIEAILKERAARLSSPDTGVRFAKITASGAPNIDVGDVVRVHVDGKVARGTVRSFDDKVASVSVGNKSHKLDRGNIIEIIQKSPGAVEAMRKKIYDYWARAVGDKNWARELTDKIGS